MGVFRVQRGPLITLYLWVPLPVLSSRLGTSFLKVRRTHRHSLACPSPGHPGRTVPVLCAQSLPLLWLLLTLYWQLFLHSDPEQKGSSWARTLVLLAVSWRPLTGDPPFYLAWLFQLSVKDLVSFLGITPCMDYYINLFLQKFRQWVEIVKDSNPHHGRKALPDLPLSIPPSFPFIFFFLNRG